MQLFSRHYFIKRFGLDKRQERSYTNLQVSCKLEMRSKFFTEIKLLKAFSDPFVPRVKLHQR